MTSEETCGERDGGLFACQKLEGHRGDRHGYNFGWMSAAWGYVPTREEEELEVSK